MRRVLRATLGSLVAGVIILTLVWFAVPRLMVGEGDMAEPRSEIHAAVLDGTIYTAGGVGFFRTLESCALFDVAQRSWTTCPDLPRALHHIAMAAGEGKVFASGGYVSLPFNIDQNPALFALDPQVENQAWTKLASLPNPLGQHAMMYREGALYLVGGDDGMATVGTLWRYTLANDRWEELAPMPTARHSHAITSDDSTLIVTGGRSAQLGSHSRIVEAYDFADNRWYSLPDLPFSLAGHGAAVIGRRLHVYGGENLDTAEVFVRHVSLDLSQPEAGWAEEAPVPSQRHGFATAMIGNEIWILGGGRRAGIRTLWSLTGTALKMTAD